MSDPISVSEFISQIKYKLEREYRLVHIEGEVINLSSSASGHWYFNLRDKDASVSMALFRGDAIRNPLIRTLKDGDKIICSGPVSVYSKRGTFQVICKSITKSGKGDLKQQFEELKMRLNQEGLFDMESKKKIPKFPESIGIITSPTGAALQDFLNIFKSRSHWMNLTLFPAVVQGDGASESIRKALFDAQKQGDFDVIVLTRGGGSIEDLWCFNDEPLAYDIYNCDIPIISAVGHEIDFTICDFVSDLRVETPSAAAQVLTEGQVQLEEKLESLSRRMNFSIKRKFQTLKEEVNDFSPQHNIQILYENHKVLEQRLEKANIIHRLYEFTNLHEYLMRLDEALVKMNHRLQMSLEKKKNSLHKFHELLNAFNPKAILERGYTYLENDGDVIKSFKDFRKLDSSSSLKIQFHDGQGEVTKND